MEWISIEDAMPPEEEFILVKSGCQTYSMVGISRCINGIWDTIGHVKREAFYKGRRYFTMAPPAFWMPLPK